VVAVAPNSRNKVAGEEFQKVAPLRARLTPSRGTEVTEAATAVGVEVEALEIVVSGLSKGIILKN
jgi:hypothetical protein